MGTEHPRPTSTDTPPARRTGFWRRCRKMPIGVQSIIAVGLGALIGSLAPSADDLPRTPAETEATAFQKEPVQ
ncbi:hypothetical protein [Streptomyces violaceus]|uniref:Uncharacterized protein n=1 Tax=Streptomyces violaceus TaxID=1936 RepID=A0ABY9UJI5_STRVL|nr:hypothetical protein [Streptomyces janthinus]WND23030.1 hypothetical protein RI060_39335 [Streptomyces janthinus]GGS55205.1 hypothetical protein GCM10010270_27040 [Streptomyces janthinus]